MEDRYDLLAPYVPRLVLDWLADDPETRYRSVPGSLVFADISGFTALTERLAVAGRAGAEEMGDLLNAVFDHLLSAAYAHGAHLVKWGGDAVLLLFDGADHEVRAAEAAWGMQRVMASRGRLLTSRGVVRLGMSIGVHTGELDALLVGTSHRELVVTGPAATAVCRSESQASRGQVLLSAEAAARVPVRCLGAELGGGRLLAHPPGLEPQQPVPAPRRPTDPGLALCSALRTHLAEGRVEHEHRSVAVGFLQFLGADALRPAARLEAVADVVEALQAAAQDHGVVLLGSDLCEDGGKLILVAGAPRSAGEHEARMLSTLREVVGRESPLLLRAGATCGGVFAGDFGPFYRRTYSLAGDVVNLAARLMSRAERGQLLATPAVVERSRTAYDTRALEPFLVKGKAKPVEAVEIGEPLRSANRAEVLPLVGRADELATLRRLADVAAHGSGQVVELVGAAGIGKSRLVRELVERSQAEVIWTEGAIYGQGRPFLPLRPLVQRAFGVRGPVAFEERGERLARAVALRAPDLVPWLPLLGAVSGVELPPTPEVDSLDPEGRRNRLEAVFSDLLARLLPPRVVLVLDDAFCADTATLGVLRRLAADAVDRSWLVLVLQRPGEPLLAPAEHVTRIELGPLDPSGAAELVRRATDQAPLRAHTARRFVEWAQGNPLFLLQLAAGGEAADDDDVPDSLGASIADQIDQLAGPERSLLRAASVFGMSVEAGWLDAVLAKEGLPRADWSGLEQHVVLDADLGTVSFRQNLVREVAYAGLPFRTRVRLHSAAAEVIEADVGSRAAELADVLLLHHAHGQRHDRTWQWGRLAGDRAARLFAPAEAARCYRWALRSAERLAWLSEDDVAEVQEALAEALLDLGEVAAAERSLRKARALSGADPERMARLCLRTASHRQHVGRHSAALAWVRRGRRALRSCEGGEAARLRARLAERGAIVQYDRGAYASALAWAQRCIAEAEAAGELLLEARGRSLAVAYSALVGTPLAEEELLSALAVFEEAGDVRGIGRAFNALGMRAYFTGDWVAAIDYYGRGEDVWRRSGRDVDAAIDAVNRAEILVQQGWIELADQVLAEAVPVLHGAAASSFLGFAITQQGRCALARGDLDEARRLLAEARAACAAMGEEEEVLTCDVLLAECLLRAGDPAGALAACEQLDRARSSRAPSWHAPQRHRVVGEALVQLERREEGETFLRVSLDVARERGALYDIAESLQRLLQLGAAADPGEADAWSREREELVRSLGLAGAVAVVS